MIVAILASLKLRNIFDGELGRFFLSSPGRFRTKDLRPSSEPFAIISANLKAVLGDVYNSVKGRNCGIVTGSETWKKKLVFEVP